MSTPSLPAEKTSIYTNTAPRPIGPYSQAIRIGSTVYLSGQIGIDPQTGELVEGGMQAELVQIFKNLQAVVHATDASFDDLVKITIFMTDLSQFPVVNETMKHYFQEPYPARSTVQVAALPKGALIEIEGIIKVKESFKKW